MKIYLIKDKRTSKLTGRQHTKTLAIVQSSDEVLKYLSDVEHLKEFKGEITIEPVVL